MSDYTWHRFDNAVKSLAANLRCGVQMSGKKKEDFRIYGNPRGGLCLAVSLSHQTGIELVTSLDEAKKKTLIWVDDIIDTGKAFRKAKKDFPEGTIFVSWLLRDEKHKEEIVYYDILFHNEWVIFPWENRTKEKK